MAGWRLSPAARNDLDAILDYVAEESGSASVAWKVAEDVAAALDTLAASPGIGWRRRQLTGDHVRWWRVHSYLLVYQANRSPLRIVRILHGSRDVARFFPERRLEP